MKTSSFLAGASRFAHLAGLAGPGRRAAEDDKDNKQGRRAEEDEDDKDGRRASDDDDDQEPKGKRGRRAADNDDDDDGDGKSGRRATDDDDDDGDAPRGKRGSCAADDDDDDDGKQGRRASEDDDKDADDDEDEMKGKGANASARRREQARIAHILGHKAAASNIALAVSLACETRMTRREAVAVLKGQDDRGGDRDDAPRGRHARRNRTDRNARLGSDVDAPTGRQAVSASWDGAFARAGIATKPRT